MKKIIVFSMLCLFFIPSFVFGGIGTWTIHGQLVQRIYSSATIIKLSQESCNLLGQNDLIWVGGGYDNNLDPTSYWAIYNMITTECLFEGNMLTPRENFPAVEIGGNKLLLIGGGTSSCEIINLQALINSTYELYTEIDPIHYPSANHSAILLNNGTEILQGGGTLGGSWQIYNLNTQSWSSVFHSTRARSHFELNNIPNSDKVIVFGGSYTYPDIEIFDRSEMQWQVVGEFPYMMQSSKTNRISETEFITTGGERGGIKYNYAVTFDTQIQEVTLIDTFPLGRCNHGAVWIEPAQKLFIGGGYTAQSATKTCYSFYLPTLSWTNEADQPGYMSWCNYFLTNDYRVFMIGNANSGYLALYSWNHAPYLINYSYATTTIPPTADISVEIHDPDLDSIATRFIFIENGDSTSTQWSEYRPSGSLFSVEHEWGSSTSSHEVICEMKDKKAPWNVHNCFADSVLVVNVGVEPDPGYPEPILMQITPHPVKDNVLISFTIHRPSEIKIDLYNLKGQLIQNVFESSCSTGNYEINFLVENLAGGIYFLKLQTETETEFFKMVLIN